MRTSFTFVLVAIVALVSAAKPRSEDDYLSRGLNHGKIVGGIEATPYEFPWLVDMRLNGNHYCGGAIITPEWIVTAAHCSKASNYTQYTLTAGDHNIDVNEGTEQVRTVVKIILHSAYQFPVTILRENDIALMKVSPPFEFNEYVSAVDLPEAGFEPTPLATVTGWGTLSSGGPRPSKLMKVDLPYVNDASCNASYSGAVAESMVCFGEAGKDSCQGDSGGPMMCGPNNTLCGIVSWGQGCALPGFPGVNTETAYFTSWVRKSIIHTPEDSSPVHQVDDCGGLLEASSVRINANHGIIPNLRCAWTVKVPYDSVRFRLVSSGMYPGDGVFVTEYNHITSMPGKQTEIASVGEDHVVSSTGLLLITFSTGQFSKGIGFVLEFYSSGYASTADLSGYAHLNAISEDLSYPFNGEKYGNGEKALFVINPSSIGDTTVEFTYMDVEEITRCYSDAVSIYSWTNNQYNLISTFCGRALPDPFLLPQGLGLVTFRSDEFEGVGNGFRFNWINARKRNCQN